MPPKTSGWERRNLTYQEKLMIIKKKDEEPAWTHQDLAVWAQERFQLVRKPVQSTISYILSSREKLENANVPPNCRSARVAKNPELDAALMAWVNGVLDTNQQEPLTRDAIQERAAQLAQELQIVNSISFSRGWVASFMKRHRLCLRKSPGKKVAEKDMEVVREADVDQSMITNEVEANQSKQFQSSDQENENAPSTATGKSGSNLDPLIEWLVAPGNFARWKMVKSAKVKQRLVGEINRIVHARGAQELNATEIRVRISSLLKSYKAARGWLAETGLHDAFAMEQEAGGDDVTAHVVNLCAHYAILAPVFSHVEDSEDENEEPEDESMLSNSKPQAERRATDTTPRLPKRRKYLKAETDPQQQLLFDLEREKLRCDIEAKHVQVMLEKILARKKLLDAGIPPAEVDNYFPL